MTSPPHSPIVNSSHSADASLTRGPNRHEEIEEKEKSAKFPKTNFTTVFDNANRHLSLRAFALYQHARFSATSNAGAPVDDLSDLWETPPNAEDSAAAIGGVGHSGSMVILNSNRSEDLHG